MEEVIRTGSVLILAAQQMLSFRKSIEIIRMGTVLCAIGSSGLRLVSIDDVVLQNPRRRLYIHGMIQFKLQ